MKYYGIKVSDWKKYYDKSVYTIYKDLEKRIAPLRLMYALEQSFLKYNIELNFEQEFQRLYNSGYRIIRKYNYGTIRR